MTIRTRFAPSPTGYLHVGGARTALYSWLYAKQQSGKFILRIEDTDLERNLKEAVDAIVDGMNWLQLNWDGEIYFQTKRFDRYNQVVDQFLAQDKAYRCYASKEVLDEVRAEQEAAKKIVRYDPEHPKIKAANQNAKDGDLHVIRFRNPTEGSVSFDDQIRGTIEISNKQLDDLIIRRSDGSPTYNFCVVVDDWDMGITHVIRGEDHINNTPKQINIYHALNAPVPTFAHCAMILGNDGTKLSKRHGAVSVMQYRDMGYLPIAVTNYLARLGWSHGDQEIFSTTEMIELFDLNSVSKSPSAFNTDKLLWLNNHYIKTSDPAYVAEHLQWHLQDQKLDTTNGADLLKVIALVGERCNTLVDLVAQIRYFYEDFADFEQIAAKKHLTVSSQAPLEMALDKFAKLTNWKAQNISQVIADICLELEIGMGKIGMPLRVAITGSGQSPAVDQVMELIEQDICLARIKRALIFVSKRAVNIA